VGARTHGGSTRRKCRRSSRTPLAPSTPFARPAGMDEGCSFGYAGAFLLAVGPLAARAHPALTARARCLAHLSRPGHLLQPGVPDRRASCAGPGLGPLSRVPRPTAQSSGPVRPHGAVRGGGGAGGGEPAQPEAESACARTEASERRGAEGTLLLGRVPRGVLTGDGCRTGERGDPDGRASVTCAGADDPKPQCRVGSLTGCPACVGWGDTSPTDDPIRKRHQDL
jgi:hypothetical protein